MKTGENIYNAFKVVKETHHSIDKLIKHCIMIAGLKDKYELISPKFLRFNSDLNYYGWCYSSFILLFNKKSEEENKSGNEVYVLEVLPFDENKLYGKELINESGIVLSRFIYPEGKEITNCTPGDNWRYYWPLRNADLFFESIDYKVYKGSLKEKTDYSKFNKDYQELQKVVSTFISMDSITGENAEEKIFGNFDRLSKIDMD